MLSKNIYLNTVGILSRVPFHYYFRHKRTALTEKTLSKKQISLEVILILYRIYNLYLIVLKYFS